MEKTRVTEIKVRMDCNGCVQKIKKALHGITGICDLYIDFPQQKITIVGWAEPVTIVKAIKKTKKSAVICSHTEQPDHSDQPLEPTSEGGIGGPEGGSPPQECINTSAEETQAAATPSPSKAPLNSPAREIPPPAEAKLSPESKSATNQTTPPPKPKDVEEIHVIHHHPPEYGYRYSYDQNLQQDSGRQWSAYNTNGMGYIGEPYKPYYPSISGLRDKPSPYNGGIGNREVPTQIHFNPHGFSAETIPSYTRNVGYKDISSQPHLGNPRFASEPSQQVHVTHNYNTYKPSHNVTEYAYPYSQPSYSHYRLTDHYNQDHYGGYNNGGNGNITSIFSEENPNACKIV